MSDEEKKLRSQNEIVRMRHTMERLKTTLWSLDQALKMPVPIGNDVAQAVVMTALEVALLIAKHDAYLLAEHDASGAVDPPFKHIPSTDRRKDR